MVKRRITVLGATGSIGTSTLDLLDRAGGAEAFDVVALTGSRNIAGLASAAKRLRAEVAVTADPTRLADLQDALAGSGVSAAAGPQALLDAAAEPADWTMSAIVGSAGLAPTLRAAQRGGTLALANKESLVCGGQLLLDECARSGAVLLPADSEHSAIFQCLRGERSAEIERVIVTASGGPFRDFTLAQMQDVTPEQAIAHPNWDMGVGISIDSASMFNKALELIEAKYLFGLRSSQIEVLVHRQSIIHSMVGFTDGSIIAQMGPPDMRGAIGFALNYPDRPDLPVERVDFAALATLDFTAPDSERFPALRLAQQVLEMGGLAGTVLNAAKEAAMQGFLDRKIGFLTMADLVEGALNVLPCVGEPSDLTSVVELDAAARAYVRAQIC
ncbi:1-deoxy-D-xylulose 5-phosphate reductoisomerase [Monaibacterium marinum]|uniref:1-deoxy-D-xylulose 5-phosphate reductoisomerase n=1 Tax=Pontivivens marinum TaxID=1690039 RepID=A0A2C9CT96_9RHOB|nr:1-deoxy-D-xylulose-5-phosphate reductoisomerase [Monaibacterium marinum]SOH93599.1 1-deoxy-D-xylulose 5-phosphate reductoisomerase [Monaibacterium marinum]